MPLVPTDPQLEWVTCPHPEGQHRMAYWRWGDASARRVVVCVHGLTRQGRDFDRLAQALLAQSPEPLQCHLPRCGGTRAQRMAGRARAVPNSAIRGRYAGHAGPDSAAAGVGQAPAIARLGGHQHGRLDRHGLGRAAGFALAVPHSPLGAQRCGPGHHLVVGPTHANLCGAIRPIP